MTKKEKLDIRLWGLPYDLQRQVENIYEVALNNADREFARRVKMQMSMGAKHIDLVG